MKRPTLNLSTSTKAASERLSSLRSTALERLTNRREVHFKLSTREIAGSLQLTEGGILQWYTLSPVNWDFLALPQRLALWEQQTYGHAKLAEGGVDGVRPVRLRITSRPYPVYEFARSLDEATPNPLAQVPGGESWNDYLAHAQRRLASTGLDEKLVMLGVWIAPAPKAAVWEELVSGSIDPHPEVSKIVQKMNALEVVMGDSGFDAYPSSAADMAYLFHRSLSMGIPAPVTAGVGGSRWGIEDLAEFTQRRAWTSHPYGRDVEIISESNGVPVHRYAMVLTVGLMPDQRWPENGRDPWMLAAAKLPFPVEWSVSGAYKMSKVLEKAITFEQNRALNIGKHYADHDMMPPPAVARAIEAARENLDEVTEGDATLAARYEGTVRLAVTGQSLEEVRERAEQVIQEFGQTSKLPLHVAVGQADQLREFIPGEPHMAHGYQRRMPVRYLAAGMPNVDNALGTPGSGFYLGYGSGASRRAVRFDPHYAQERLNKPGLYPVVAEPGGGKSVLLGTLAYNAVRMGEDCIILDPSGPLAKLAELPELEPYSRVINLSDADAGTLSPYLMVPEPHREDFEGPNAERDYQRAVRRAASDRQQLAFDVLRQWLPVQLLRREGTDVVLRDGVRAAAQRAEELGISDTATNPRWILEAIEQLARAGGASAAKTPRTRKTTTTRKPSTRTTALAAAAAEVSGTDPATLDPTDQGTAGQDAEAPAAKTTTRKTTTTKATTGATAARRTSRAGSVTAKVADLGEVTNALAEAIAAELRAAAEFPLGELIMPMHSEPLQDTVLDDRRLVIITMPGLATPPEGKERDEWGVEERYTAPLLHLAAFFASRFIYSRPRDVRKSIMLDENQLMSQWQSGRSFVVRLSRDSRKHDCSVYLGSQHPDDHTSIGRIDALMGGAFVGRLTDPVVAEKACGMLRAPKEYARVIQSLSPINLASLKNPDMATTAKSGETGEFVFLDPLGRLGRMRVDMYWHPSLVKALDTTPGRKRRNPERDRDYPAPFIDESLMEEIELLDASADTAGITVESPWQRPTPPTPTQQSTAEEHEDATQDQDAQMAGAVA